MALTSKKQMAEGTEQEILNYLKNQKKAVSFYKLYSDLNYTSGKAQSALKRLQEQKEIHVRKKIEKFKTFVWYKPFELEPDPLEVEDENTIIFPVRLNKIVGAVFQEIPNVDPTYKNFMEIVKDALIQYFQSQLPPELKEKAIRSAVEKGIIAEELGEKLLKGE